MSELYRECTDNPSSAMHSLFLWPHRFFVFLGRFWVSKSAFLQEFFGNWMKSCSLSFLPKLCGIDPTGAPSSTVWRCWRWVAAACSTSKNWGWWGGQKDYVKFTISKSIRNVKLGFPHFQGENVWRFGKSVDDNFTTKQWKCMKTLCWPF